MKWNDGVERKRFEAEQKELREQYLAAGMTEEQAQAMYEFDLDWYKSRRKNAIHTQRLEPLMEDGERKDNPLEMLFPETLTTEDKHFESSRLGWIEEIEDKELYSMLKSLSEDDLEILTCYIFDGMTQKDIAVFMGTSQQAISKKIKKMKEILKNGCKNSILAAYLMRGEENSTLKENSDDEA